MLSLPLLTITDTSVPFVAPTVQVAGATRIHAGDLVQISKPVTAAWILLGEDEKIEMLGFEPMK